MGRLQLRGRPGIVAHRAAILIRPAPARSTPQSRGSGPNAFPRKRFRMVVLAAGKPPATWYGGADKALRGSG